MIRKLALAAVAAASIWAMPAAAQNGPWRVVAAVPDIAIFAGDITGPENARSLHIFVMLPEAVGGVDNSVNRWTVDCRARTANDHGGKSYLGAQDTGPLESVTPNGAEPFSEGLVSLVGNYACDGKRLSDDNSALSDVNAARAFARARFRQK